MRKLLKQTGALFCLLLSVASCSSPAKTEKPHPFIPPAKMQELMTDLYKLEATLRVAEREQQTDLSAYGRQQWDSLLRKHGVTAAQWEENFYYYISESELSDTLFSRVTNRLSAWETKASKAMKKDTSLSPAEELPVENVNFEEITLF